MKEKIKKWLSNQRSAAMSKSAERIKSEFYVSERDGYIYLIHSGFAFAKMPTYESASEITSKLNEARKAALEFEGYEH